MSSPSARCILCVETHFESRPIFCATFCAYIKGNALIKSSLLYGSETWRLTENNKRRVEATEMDALIRFSRISRKERIRNVTIRQKIGLEETIIK